MNKELFQSMQKQMTPSPEVRAALSERPAQPAKKRPVAWMKYGAVAACAALVIGAFSVYSLYQNPKSWMWTYYIKSFQTDPIEPKLHSYVTVEDMTGYFTENTAVTENTMTGGGDTGHETGAIPGGAYIGDAPSQEEAADAYQKLMDRFNGTYPDWYGGAYLDNSGWLVVLLVEDGDPGDKSLELQVLDWAGSDKVMFTSCKYSLAQLNELMDWLNRLPDTDPKCSDVMAGWGVDEEHNRIELTLTQVDNYVLSVLAGLDPADDMILVQVGQRAIVSEGDDNLIAVEPWVDDLDGAHYGTEDGAAARHDILELPEQKQPAAVQSVFDFHVPIPS